MDGNPLTRLLVLMGFMFSLVLIPAIIAITIINISESGGFDKNECRNSAMERGKEHSMDVYNLPGSKYKFIAVSEDGDVRYLETMAITHCNVTEDVQLN